MFQSRQTRLSHPSRTAGTRSAARAEAGAAPGAAQGGQAAAPDAAPPLETPAQASGARLSSWLSLREAQSSQRRARIDQPEPEGIVAARRAQIDGGPLQQVLDRARIGHSLLHDTCRHAREVRR